MTQVSTFIILVSTIVKHPAIRHKKVTTKILQGLKEQSEGLSQTFFRCKLRYLRNISVAKYARAATIIITAPDVKLSL
jgi:hypothetical protein